MIKRTNEDWLTDLSSEGVAHDQALIDLHEILLSGLRRGLLGHINTAAPEFETQAEDFVQEALLKILAKKETFAGRAKFTTWAHKIAVSVALTELRRKRWKDSSLDGAMDADSAQFSPAIMADKTPQPAAAAERNDMLNRIQTLITEKLTERQRMALTAYVIQGQPATAVAADLNIKPNALYKLIHDARARLRKSLADEGLTPAEVLAVF